MASALNYVHDALPSPRYHLLIPPVASTVTLAFSCWNSIFFLDRLYACPNPVASALNCVRDVVLRRSLDCFETSLLVDL